MRLPRLLFAMLSFLPISAACGPRSSGQDECTLGQSRCEGDDALVCMERQPETREMTGGVGGLDFSGDDPRFYWGRANCGPGLCRIGASGAFCSSSPGKVVLEATDGTFVRYLEIEVVRP